MKLPEKHLKHGDIIAIRRDRWLSKAIATWTSSHWSHVGLVVRYGDEWFIIDSNEKGVDIDFLERRLESVEDLTILRPKTKKYKITKAVAELEKFCKVKTRYDLPLVKTAINVNLNLNSKGFTCTELMALYISLLGIDHKLNKACTAQDFLEIEELTKII